VKYILKILLRNLYELIIYTFASLNSGKEIIVFSADGGRRYADNPRYVFEYICSLNSTPVPFWIGDTNKLPSTFPKKYADNYVNRYSIRGFLLLATAKYFVSSHSPYGADLLKLIPKNRSLFVIWHGTPVKKMIPTRPGIHRKLLQSKIIPTKVFVQCYEEERILAQNWDMREDVFEITSYPRNIYLKSERKEKNIVVWAPTFRDGVDQAWLEDKLYPTRDDFIRINNYLLQSDLKLIVKEHPYSNGNSKHLFDDLGQIDALSKYSDFNQALVEARYLITDYSSAVFDFLQVGGQVGFYVPDLSWYDSTQGRGLDQCFKIILKEEGEKNFHNCLKKLVNDEQDSIKKLIFSSYRFPNVTTMGEFYALMKKSMNKL